MTDRDTTWTIHTESDGALEFEGAIGNSYPTFGAGKSVSTILYSHRLSDTPIKRLREFGRYIDDETVETGTDLRGQPWFYQTIHPHAQIKSTLVRISPGADINIDEWWCVITDVELETTSSGTSPRVEAEMFVLGKVEEYETRDLAEDAFESDVVGDQ